jgi:hypothetical protein
MHRSPKNSATAAAKTRSARMATDRHPRNSAGGLDQIPVKKCARTARGMRMSERLREGGIAGRLAIEQS